jgi:hypothetical protein
MMEQPVELALLVRDDISSLLGDHWTAFCSPLRVFEDDDGIVDLFKRLDHLTRDRLSPHQLLSPLREDKRVLLCSHTFLPDKLIQRGFHRFAELRKLE